MEAATVVAKALKEARESAASFADLLIADVAFANGANQVITFDKALGRRPRLRQPSKHGGMMQPRHGVVVRCTFKWESKNRTAAAPISS